MKGNGKGSHMEKKPRTSRNVNFWAPKELVDQFYLAIEGVYSSGSEAFRAFMRETVEKAEAKPQ